MSINNGSENLSILDSFVRSTVDIVLLGVGNLDGEQESLFKGLHKLFFIRFLHDVLNLECGSSSGLELYSHSLAILMQIDLGNCMAHIVIYLVHPVDTE